MMSAAQRSLDDYRVQPKGFVCPSQEESKDLTEIFLIMDHHGKDSIRSLLDILQRDTMEGDEFMVDELFDKVKISGFDRRILGPMIRQAHKYGLVKRLRLEKSTIKAHHGLYKTVWQRTDKMLEEPEDVD